MRSPSGLRLCFLVGQQEFRVRLTLFYSRPWNLGQKMLALERLLVMVDAAFAPLFSQGTLECRYACINVPSLT
jgi:hypothetical protein